MPVDNNNPFLAGLEASHSSEDSFKIKVFAKWLKDSIQMELDNTSNAHVQGFISEKTYKKKMICYGAFNRLMEYMWSTAITNAKAQVKTIARGPEDLSGEEFTQEKMELIMDLKAGNINTFHDILRLGSKFKIKDFHRSVMNFIEDDFLNTRIAFDKGMMDNKSYTKMFACYMALRGMFAKNWTAAVEKEKQDFEATSLPRVAPLLRRAS